MNDIEKFKFEIEARSLRGGYFLVITNDEILQREFIKYVDNNIEGIEILRDYSFRLDVDNIRNKVQDKSVMLTDLEEKIEEELNFQNSFYKELGTFSRDFAIYLGLIRYREYLRKHALTLLCDRKTAASIRAYNSNLSQFARNYMYLDEYKDVLEKANKENESKALVKTNKT